MKTKLNVIASALFLLFAPMVMAADVAVITLDNGANVRLKDDFTWEYIITETVAQPVVATQTTASTPIMAKSASSTATSVAPIAVTSMPAVSVKTPVAPSLAPTVATTRLTTAAMAQPSLLGSTAKDGIKVMLADTQWKGDKLGLVFDFYSSSDDHVTVVNVEASFFDDQGGLIKTETIEAWEAIFRMPETYLRKGQHRTTTPFWIEGINKQQWQKQLVSLKIIEIESR